MRLETDDFFMKLAYDFSEQSTCTRRKVGCVIVKSKRIISAGYNGAPSSIEHCTPETCIRTQMNIPSGERHELCIGGHSESNAIANAAENGISTSDSTLYCTTYPCAYCAKVILRAGITRVVYDQGYPDEISEKLFKDIQVDKYIGKFNS